MSSSFPPTIILAGGIGTRLGALSEKAPKAMMPIAGRPFIDYQLRLLAEQGLSEVILSVAYLSHQIEDYVGDGSKYSLSVTYAYDGKERLGTGGAIQSALHFVGDCFAVLYGDTFLDIEYKPVHEAFLASGKDGLMTVLHNQNSWDKSNVQYEHDKIIVYDKHNQTTKMHHIDYGLSILTKSCFSGFPENQSFDLAEVFMKCVQEDRIAGYEVHKRFYEIGTPASLAETEAYLQARESSRA